MLDVNFLGYGGAWFPEAGNTSAFIKINDIDKNILYLFDCGETVFSKMMKYEVLKDVDELNILITHFHSDHIGSLGTLITYAYFAADININLYTPDIKKLAKILKCQGVYSEFYNSIDNIFSLSNHKIKFIDVVRVFHTSELEAYSYVFEDELNNIYIYTGDIKHINNNLMYYINDPQMRYLYIDTNVNGESPVHLSLSDLLNQVDSSLHKYIYCMHLNDNSEIELVKKYGLNSVSDILYKGGK